MTAIAGQAAHPIVLLSPFSSSAQKFLPPGADSDKEVIVPAPSSWLSRAAQHFYPERRTRTRKHEATKWQDSRFSASKRKREYFDYLTSPRAGSGGDGALTPESAAAKGETRGVVEPASQRWENGAERGVNATRALPVLEIPDKIRGGTAKNGNGEEEQLHGRDVG